MKSHVADYLTRVYCARIEPANDSPIVRLTAYPTNLKMSNEFIYFAGNGYEFSGYGTGTKFSSSSMDLNGILQAGFISKDDLDSGVYDNARLYVFATTWNAPIEDEEPIGSFIMGAVTTEDNDYSAQLMSLIDVVAQDVGRTYSPVCPWTLFDRTLDGKVLPPNRSRCTGPRGSPDGPLISDYLVTGSVTSVFSASLIVDSARDEPDDWFGYGNIRFTNGPNAGLKPMQIKSYADGQIELIESFFYMPSVGDEYEMIPGCRKRLSQDCVSKFSNGINHGGQAHVPTGSQYSQVGRGA